LYIREVELRPGFVAQLVTHPDFIREFSGPIYYSFT